MTRVLQRRESKVYGALVCLGTFRPAATSTIIANGVQRGADNLLGPTTVWKRKYSGTKVRFHFAGEDESHFSTSASC